MSFIPRYLPVFTAGSTSPSVPADCPTSVLHGPGLGPRAGPARSQWAGPGQVSIIVCGPGRVRACNLQFRAGPGLVSNNFAGCGPGLGLTFPGLGRARVYSESPSYFTIMVKDYLYLSIAISSLFSMLSM